MVILSGASAALNKWLDELQDMVAGDGGSSDTGQPLKVDIALKAKHSQSIFSLTAESSADVGRGVMA
ncbi:hypothetical protein GXM_08487 [Nostoc sphaeroides CCNUC1]|uniref:Uncharacterized protein n=1 Tax=Nostoc sphaeroides CCNUC1 TaxID=2653204 RepID=A0A5P8WDV5_9NOSO|nr:hypothetical protein GXM_08487 [Nostoc sphaeroides CCNUC1]